MKKFNYIFFSLLALLFVTSCEEPQDKNPVLQTPTKFVLNNPVMSTQYIELTPTTTVNLSCSQPDYGYASAANYYAQVSFTEDFAEFAEVNENPYTNCAKMEVSGEELAMAMCKLRGVTTEESYVDEPACPLFVRLRAEIKGAPQQSAIVSNVVVLNQVKAYYAVKLPGYIYLVGQPSGWNEPSAGNAAHYENWKLLEAEDAIGSKVYSGTFEVAAGQATFRFYRKLQGWDAKDENDIIYSLGLKEADEATNVEFTDGLYTSPIVDGKGSFSFPDWAGGKMKITVDMSSLNKEKRDFKVTIQVVE